MSNNDMNQIFLNRNDILDAAKDLVNGDRQSQYGDPAEMWTAIAEAWTAYLGTPVSPTDAICMMIAMKLQRIRRNPHHTDSWIDIAAYAGLGGEVAEIVRVNQA